jgi:hypothetical protein
MPRIGGYADANLYHRPTVGPHQQHVCHAGAVDPERNNVRTHHGVSWGNNVRNHHVGIPDPEKNILESRPC